MEDHFQRRRFYSQYWFNKASDLRGAAAAVWVSMDEDVGPIVVERTNLGSGFNMQVAVSPVFGMLCGMSLELLFKAITVERQEQVNEQTHDLLAHLTKTGIVYSDEERQLLKIYAHAATWEGRYPAPKKKAAMTEFHDLVYANLFDRVEISPGSKFKVLRPNGAAGWDAFENLWRKACTQYFQIKADI